MKILVINGPSLNMLGIREKNVYGSGTYKDLVEYVSSEAGKLGAKTEFRQSNHEGDLIDWLQDAYCDCYDGVVINPGGYTHTSVALADAIAAIAPLPVAEVHISDIDAREDFRKVSFCAPHCIAQIKGLGFAGYIRAIEEIIRHVNGK